jgi:drug/metabolite transporter (DMT)-like permease
VVVGFHLVALIPLGVLVIATNALARVDFDQIVVFVVLGAVGWLSYLAFYGALAIGPISVLSPIVSGYAAVTVLCAVVVVGERLSLGQTVAVLITILGAMISSANVRDIASATIDRRSLYGFALALIAMVLLGGFVFGVSYYHAQIGWLGPIFLARGFAAIFLVAHLAYRGGLRSVPRLPRTLLGSIILLAALDTGGYVCFNLGVNHAPTAVVATASAPYALVPVLMGVSILRERPTPTQWLGVTLVIGGLITLGLTS